MEETNNKDKVHAENNASGGTAKVLTQKQIERRRKVFRFLVITAAIILPALTIFIWKQVQINKLEKSHASEVLMLKKTASDFVKSRNESGLKLVSRVLSWAVSNAIKSGNVGEASNYMVLAVKENKIKQIQLVSPAGIVMISTDKKSEGSPFNNPFPEESFNVDSTRLRVLPTGDYMIASSMYNVDKRFGVLILTAAPDTINFEVKEIK